MKILIFFSAICPLLMYIFKKTYSNPARECEISDNIRKHWMKVEHVQLFYNYMDEVKIVNFFKIHYPLFTFPFNWIRLNGWCILRLKRKIHYPVIQLFEYEQLSILIKLIERIGQIFVNAPLKSLLHIY